MEAINVYDRIHDAISMTERIDGENYHVFLLDDYDPPPSRWQNFGEDLREGAR
jgi:hypothetical protein